MNAVKLRYVLIGLIALLVIGLGAGAWWVHTLLTDSVRQTDHTQIDADIASTELQQLKSLQKQFTDEQDVISRAKQIAASADQYKYQDQVIDDVTDYATRYGIQVSSFDFSTSPNAAKAQSIGGATKTAFTVTLKGPLTYTTFLRFLNDLELNLTKLQVTSLTLAPDKDTSKITNPSLGLEVYIKS